jgi:putative RecB family exonuclease
MADALPPYLSPSSISTFEQCPLKYKYTRIDKMPEPPTEATLMGNFVHEVMEGFYALPPEDRTISSVKEISSYVWTESGWRERVEPILFNSAQVKSGKSTLDKEINNFRWKSWFCIENIFSIENPLEVAPAGIETELNGQIDGVQIKGFIDRWSKSSSGLVISDYKTGKSPAPRFAGDKFMQLLIYALVLSNDENLPVDELQLLYLKDNRVMTLKPTQEHLTQTVERIRKVWDGVVERCSSGEWETIPHRLCDWCNFKNTICPQWNGKK